MRPELNQIERIERFLDGKMEADEKILFEKELAINPDLKEAVDTQALMITAINRKALLTQVQQFAPGPRSGGGGNSASILSKFKWPIILSSIVVGAVITWFATIGNERPEKIEEPTVTYGAQQHQSENQIASDSSSIALDEKIAENPARQTSTTLSSRKEFGGLETLISPEVQRIVVDPKKDELIECKDGTVILIPKHAFADQAGNIVTEPVTLEIIEALTKDKMIGYNLATMNDGKPLESAGMLYIQPKRNGKNLLLADGKSIHVEIPTDNYNANMKAWEGVADGNGNLNWVNPKEIENYLVPVDLASLDFIPDGFREEVQNTLPFRNYKTSTKALEDSLYYSFGAKNSSQNWSLPWYKVSSPVSESQSFDGEISYPEILYAENPELQSTGRHNQERSKRLKTFVKFRNLPEDRNLNILVVQKELNYSFLTQIENNESTIKNYVGPATIRIYSNECELFFDDIVFTDVMDLTLDCTNIKCGEKQEEFLNFSSSDACEKCYIDPSIIHTIHNSSFANTFVATTAFRDRLQALHKIKNAEPLLQLYITQLDKNMHEIDAQVAKQLMGSDKKKFEEFAAQKLTNVKPSDQNYELIQEYYKSELKRQNEEIRERRNKYNRQSSQELQTLQNELNKVKKSYLSKSADLNSTFVKAINKERGVSRFAANSMNGNLPISNQTKKIIEKSSKPRVARDESYKVSWYNTGWMNIDSYMKELAAGEKVVEIKSPSESARVKVYQSFNAVNTVINLNKLNDHYDAYFPTNPSRNIYDNCLSIAILKKSDNQFAIATRAFNPYKTKTIELEEWKTLSESEFREALKTLNPGSKNLLQQMDRENAMIEAQLNRRQRIEELQKQREADLAALKKEFEAQQQKINEEQRKILERQAKERAFIKNLENTINPCYQGSSNEENIVSFPDEEAEYIGGITALNKFIMENISYPEEAIRKGISGEIYISFIVETDGSLTGIRVVDPDLPVTLLEEEAMRLVSTMPNWKPAVSQGQNVRSKVRLPIEFKLE